MVLPFETTVTEVSAALGYAVVDVLDVTENSNDMHLKLHMGKIEANQPFIVKYYKEDELYTTESANTYNTTNAEAITAGTKTAVEAGDIAVNNATLDLSGLEATAFGNKTIVYDADGDNVNAEGNVFVENANNGHQFIGVYNPVEVYGAEYKWISRGKGELVDGSKYTESEKAPMRRLIGYFKLNTANGNARILIDEPDGSTTVINAVTAETMNVQADGWYTLNGVKLQSIPTQKGIYINNGKKVVIK